MVGNQSKSLMRVFRGAILDSAGPETLVYHADGGLVVDADGRILACDAWKKIEASVVLKNAEMIQLPAGSYIMPGFIDMHVHLPQMAVTGCQERDLLSWLERHIFPEEAKFSDADYAQKVSQWFLMELLRNGTTTAAVFLTSHQSATQIAFETAERLGNRMIMGQNLMDINAPDALTKPAVQLLSETETLCKRWHEQDAGRLQYAWMPRFALTSSEELLAGIGALRQKYPSVYLHTHLSEQLTEIEAVKQQFPQAEDYTAVYERFGLLAAKTILAHGIHLSDNELDRIQATQCGIAHCPSSNFFLKSGKFRLLEILQRKILLGLGSDVGAGPELSMFKTMRDAQFRQDDWVPVASLLYMATLGAAKALFLDDSIGSLIPGKEADFIIVNPTAKPGFALPNDTTQADNNPEMLFSRLMYLGDDRMIRSTYVRGKCVASQ